MKKPLIIFILVLSLTVMATAAYWNLVLNKPSVASDCPDFTTDKLLIKDQEILIGIAETQEKKSLGLGGCGHVPPGQGLYFPISPPRQASVWMKAMLIPIDVVWINGDRVVGLEKGLPAPNPETPLANLSTYRAPEPITAFLELSAGEVDRLNISPGDSVSR